MNPVLAGLLTGLSLIVAIGAQNAFVLRCGLARHHVGVVVAIMTVSDVVLIALGASGVGTVVAAQPTLLSVVTWAGAGYLTWCGVRSLRNARQSGGLTASGVATPSLTAVVGTALALTHLNPHVYLDTVLMLGTVASSYGSGRWLFAGGAMLASVLWFSGIGFAAGKAEPYLRSARVWKVVDLSIGLVMFAIAITLVLSLR